jgi:hypothetical protein
LYHDEDRELGGLVVVEIDALADVVGELLGDGAVEGDAAVADVERAVDERVLEVLRLGLAGDLAGLVLLLVARDLVGQAGDGVGGLELELLGLGLELADLVVALGQAGGGAGGLEGGLALELGAFILEGGGLGVGLGQAQGALGVELGSLGVEGRELLGALGLGEGELGVDAGLLGAHAVDLLHRGLLLGREFLAVDAGAGGDGGRAGLGRRQAAGRRRGRGGGRGARGGGAIDDDDAAGRLGEDRRGDQESQGERAEDGAGLHGGDVGKGFSG